jgi:hypothetical protein
MAITSWGHFMAFVNESQKEMEYFQYFKYSIAENYTEAMEIFYIGILFILYGYYSGETLIKRVPLIKTNLMSMTIYDRIFYFSLVLMIFPNLLPIPSALVRIITMLPQVGMFIFNIIGIKYKINRFKLYSIVLLAITVVINLFTSYLRFTIIAPIFLYIISYIVSEKKITYLYSIRSLPVYIALIFFSVSFSKLGSLRSQYEMTWEQKLEVLMDFKTSDDKKVSQDEFEEENKKQTILSRSTVINQLTQLVKVKKEDGFYYGETMLYLTYVFIPRFLWPEKPIIQQGAWFAERIGLAYRNEAGFVNNSINMTIYGEAYLNFGYLGIVLICFLFGYFLNFLWKSSGEMNNYFNLLGMGFSLYLIGYATFQLGSDLQIVITFLSVYLTFLAFGYILREIFN